MLVRLVFKTCAPFSSRLARPFVSNSSFFFFFFRAIRISSTNFRIISSNPYCVIEQIFNPPPAIQLFTNATGVTSLSFSDFFSFFFFAVPSVEKNLEKSRATYYGL